MPDDVRRRCDDCGAVDDYPGRDVRCTECESPNTRPLIPALCPFCGGAGSIKVDFEHPQWIRCDACKGSGKPHGAAIVDALRDEWANATTGETWELFLERELATLLPRVERMNELLGHCRMRGDLPKDLYDDIDSVLDKEYRT